MTLIKNPAPCSLPRRFAAISYDGLLLISIFFTASFILLPLIGDSGIESGNLYYDGFLLLLAYLYFCWHWTSGRQTLGMRSWKIHVVTKNNASLNWKQTTLRYFSALLSLMLLGLGFIWAILDKEKLTLHDRLSKTKLVVTKKEE